MQGEYVGFTGTSHGGGMTARQCDAFKTLVNNLAPVWFHHGDCIGADAQAHDIVRLTCERTRIFGHPASVDPSMRAFKECDTLVDARPPLKRNHDIVDRTLILVAAPRGKEEELRSGTWATVRYAQQMKRIIYYVHYDGTIQEHEYK